MRDVQLFDRQGNYVTTVKLPLGHDIITWGGRYFRFDAGRFVEGTMHVSTEPQR